jgi:hypothetical protein
MERTDDHLLTLKDVARVLARAPDTVREMIREGKFPEGFPAPDKDYWRWGDVREWVIRHKLMKELGISPQVKPRKSPDSPGNAPETDSGSSGNAKRR